MEIEITVYKDSGKYYTSSIIRNEIEIPLWENNFKQFVRDNCPANIEEGFIVTRDVGNGFHDKLYRYEEIFN